MEKREASRKLKSKTIRRLNGQIFKRHPLKKEHKDPLIVLLYPSMSSVPSGGFIFGSAASGSSVRDAIASCASKMNHHSLCLSLIHYIQIGVRSTTSQDRQLLRLEKKPIVTGTKKLTLKVTVPTSSIQ